MKEKLKTETKLYGGGGIAMTLLYLVGIVMEGTEGFISNAWMILAATLLFTEAADSIERGPRPFMLYAGFVVMAILVKFKQPVISVAMVMLSVEIIGYQIHRVWKKISAGRR